MQILFIVVMHIAKPALCLASLQECTGTKDTNTSNERSNPNLRETDQLAIYKAWRGIWTFY